MWSEDILKYLTQLRGRFTSYKLKNISNLKSAHAIRIYELLMRFKKTGHRTISVSEFKETLGIKNKYGEYKALNQWVIQPSLRELKKSNVDVLFTTVKKGRAVEYLVFDFKTKDQLELSV